MDNGEDDLVWNPYIHIPHPYRDPILSGLEETNIHGNLLAHGNRTCLTFTIVAPIVPFPI
jgi:hypothetical protein